MIEIRQEDILEQRETENVVREAFWNVYSPGCCEHYLVHKIRRSGSFVPKLNLVAICSGMIIGHVINIKSYIEGDDGKRHEVLSLGPIAVLPQFFNRLDPGVANIFLKPPLFHKSFLDGHPQMQARK